MRTVERGAAARLLQLPNLPQHFGELRGAYSIMRKEQLLRTAYLAAVKSDAKIVNYLARRLVESGGKPPSLKLPSAGAK